MKGIVLQLLGCCARGSFGEDTWLGAMATAGLSEPIDPQGIYSDHAFNAVVTALATSQGITSDQAQRWFGDCAIGHFHAMAPDLFDRHQDSWSFLLTLNDIIHPQVRRDFPGADAPDFGFDAHANGDLVLTYHSPRRMCAFAEGLILASMRHYGDPPLLAHARCMHRGDPHCEFVLAAPAA